MKKPKVVKPFYFNELSNSQVSQEIDKNFPIGLSYNHDLIDRIYKQYPLVNKSDIAIVVKTIFQTLREFLILGKVINFNNLFFDTKLHFFTHRKKGRIFPSLKVKISTPPPLRKL